MSKSKLRETQVLDVDFLSEEEHLNLTHYFIELGDTPTTLSGQAGKVVSVNGAENGLEYTISNRFQISEEEKFCWQIKLAKLRPSLLQEASSNFTPSGYDIYPIVANNWRMGTFSEFESGPCYPQTISIKSGTPINFESNGFMLYVKSTDVHSVIDQIQNNNPKMEYFKRIKYIQNINYEYITAWMSSNGWNTQAISPGTYGVLLVSYTFTNIREFTMYNSDLTNPIYNGNLQTYGTSGLGFSRHEGKFLIPINSTIYFDVRAARNPSGGGVYTVKYINVPERW